MPEIIFESKLGELIRFIITSKNKFLPGQKFKFTDRCAEQGMVGITVCTVFFPEQKMVIQFCNRGL